MLNFLAIALIMAAQPPKVIVAPALPKAPLKLVQEVHIGKAKFKVFVRGNVAEVRRKNFAFNKNAAHFVMSVQAAELATGCKAEKHFDNSDAFTNGPVVVTLNCDAAKN